MGAGVQPDSVYLDVESDRCIGCMCVVYTRTSFGYDSFLGSLDMSSLQYEFGLRNRITESF